MIGVIRRFMQQIKEKLKDFIYDLTRPFRRLYYNTIFFYKYGKLGWDMNCTCCYDHLLELMIFRLEEMISAKGSSFVDRTNDIKNMKTCVFLLKRVLEDDYFWPQNRVGVFKAKERGDAYPWDEDYVNPIAHIPRTVMNRHHKQRQKDLKYALELMSKHMLSWWV